MKFLTKRLSRSPRRESSVRVQRASSNWGMAISSRNTVVLSKAQFADEARDGHKREIPGARECGRPSQALAGASLFHITPQGFCRPDGDGGQKQVSLQQRIGALFA